MMVVALATAGVISKTRRITMAQSAQTKLAQQRNGAKWRLAGQLSNMRNMQCSKFYTQAEQAQLAPAIAILEGIHTNWNQSNTEFGLKNPDLKEKK